MQLKIKTDVLKEMMTKAIKGAGNNKLIPLTGLMELRAENDTLTITTTDAINYLYVMQSIELEEEFSVVLGVEKFSKLISKMTCENIVLIFHPDMQLLEVNGNGNYKIELPLDESGQLISYPNPLPELPDTYTQISAFTVQTIINTLKPSLATTLEIPCYTGFYVGDIVIATDTYRVASMNTKLFDDYSCLISSETMSLLSLMSDEYIEVYRPVDSNVIVYKTPDCIVFSNVMEGVEEFSVDAIKGLINTDFSRKCVLDRSLLLQVLDRLSIFVGVYDKNAITLTFTADGLQLSSRASTGIETIPYIESDNFEPYECSIDIESITQEIKAIASDRIELYYGLPNAVKIVDDNITIIVALLEENN